MSGKRYTEEFNVIKDSHLTRLIRAYPAQAEGQLLQAPAFEGACSVDAVLARFHDAAATPIGKAIALAVMLDQDECGESQLDTPTRERAVQLFEGIFNELASA